MKNLAQRGDTVLEEAGIDPVPIDIVVPQGFWMREAEHFPQPVTATDKSLFFGLAEVATQRWMEEFGLLMEQVEFGDIGGWHYLRLVPLGGKEGPTPPRWLMRLLVRVVPSIRRRLKACQEAVRSRKAERFIDQWYEEWLPMLERRIEELRQMRLGALTDAELASHAEAMKDLVGEATTIHALLHGSEMIVIADLAFTCRDLLGWEESRTFEMLGGLSYKSTEPAHRLAELSRTARERPAVLSLLKDADASTPGRIAAVDPEFAQAFEAYQQAYGCRAMGYGAADLTIAEAPEFTLRLIQQQVQRGYDPEREAAELEEKRRKAIDEARSALAARPVEDRERFERVLASAQRAYPVREDNEFFTISAPCAFLRYLILELGTRLAERGQIARRDDAFFLDYDDTLDVLTSGDARHELVRKRKGERAWAWSNPGPQSYGKDPGPPPSFDALPAEARFAHEALMWVIDRMGMPVPQEVEEANAASGGEVLRGIGASGGSYTGPVRVIMDESQFDKLRAGDVLVCPVTSPVWSVMFPSVGALVTDTGGILSHPAIIAREYVIPAVVSTGNATDLLRDGQMVTVDGDSGVVTAQAGGKEG